MRTQKKRLLIAAILCISIFQMGMVALSPVIQAITKAFPGTSSLTAQMAMTFLNLFQVIFALLSGIITDRIGRRWTGTVGIALTALAGICGPLLSKALWTLFIWSAMLGAGAGMFVPVASNLMVAYLDEAEQKRVLGFQSAAANIGAVFLSLLAGVLASVHWSNAYLVYLTALPVIFLCIAGIPKAPPAAADVKAASEAAVPDTGTPGKARIPLRVWLGGAQTFIFAVCYFAYSTNISLLLDERGITSTTVSGVFTAIFMLGGCVIGLNFGRIMGLVRRKTPALAFALLVVTYLLIYAVELWPVTLIAAFVAGGSLSLLFPYLLMTAMKGVDPRVSVISTSVIVAVCPNLGSFVSPVVISGITGSFGGTLIADRFLTAAVIAGVLTILLLVTSGSRRAAD